MQQSLPAQAQAAAIAPQSPKQEKKHRISKRLLQVIELYESGVCKDKKTAAERVGLSLSYVYRELKKPHVRVFCEQRARQLLALGIVRAAARQVELIDAESEHVGFDASKHVLGIAGIKPAADAQLTVNIEQKAGYVIVLDGRRPSEHSQPESHDPAISTTYEADSVDEA